MPTGLQANNLGPRGFGQPNMNRAASQQGGPGYGMPARPVAPGQQPQPSAPPGGTGRAPVPNAPPLGIPLGLYQSSMGQEAITAKPRQFPGDAVYNRVQKAILNPGPPRPPVTTGPPIGPGEATIGAGPTAVGRPVMGPGLLGPAPTPQAPPPTGGPMAGPTSPIGPGSPDFAAALQFMQQQLGGQS
jgi:hypothetical protein